MSLIYDALRSLPAAEKAVPVHGSVTDSRVALVRRTRRMSVIGGGLVVVLIVALLFHFGRQAEHTAVEPERSVPQGEGLATAAVSDRQTSAAPAGPGETVAGKRREAVLVEPLRPAVTGGDAAAASPPPSRTLRVPVTANAPSAAAEPTSPVPPVPVPVVQKPARTEGERPGQAAEPPATPATAAAPVAPAVRPVVTPAPPRLAARAPAVPPAAASSAEADETPVVEHSALDVGDSLRRFNAMVGRGEFVPAGKLLDELRERGLNRLALARMSAYLALRAERLDDARRDYEQVLALLPADREAGLNLAIIDARQGFSSQAEQRLRTLTELHPDDGQVRAMLNRVRAQGNTP